MMSFSALGSVLMLLQPVPVDFVLEVPAPPPMAAAQVPIPMKPALQDGPADPGPVAARHSARLILGAGFHENRRTARFCRETNCAAILAGRIRCDGRSAIARQLEGREALAAGPAQIGCTNWTTACGLRARRSDRRIISWPRSRHLGSRSRHLVV